MFGFLNLFGRSAEQQRFERALRADGLHPYLMPEAIKIAAMKQVKDATGALSEENAKVAAHLLSYCMLGPVDFRDSNGEELAAATEQRLDSALTEGDSLDARLILLCLHAGLIDPDLSARYDLASE